MRSTSESEAPQTEAQTQPHNMDRARPKTQSKRWWWLLALSLPAGLLYFNQAQLGGYGVTVAREQIVVAAVERGIFEDFIPLRARVIPAKTLYLDAVQGGRVEQVLVEDGSLLEQGALIATLSNAQLQLNVLSNEARVAEQLNSMRNIELRLQQNRLQHKSNLADIDYQIKMLTRKLEAEKALVAKQSLSRSQYEDTRDTLRWYRERHSLTLESQASDETMQQSQLAFLQHTSERLQSSLALSRKSLDSLQVRAPVAGKLSGFNIEVGQSIGRGERLGQIDTPKKFKLSALIDEFYLDRVDLEQQAQFENYSLRVSKVYAQVQNGQFEVELAFIDQSPPGIRRGQSLQLRLTLGDASTALLIPYAAFYQDTGGAWLFVLSQTGDRAYKRSVRLGRRNNRFIEVIEGLDAGEKVITSPYSQYLKLEKINISQ